MTIYRSKIDNWIIAVLGGSILLPLILMLAFKGPLMITLLITIPMLGFLVWLYIATKYEILKDELIIHAGLYKVNIPRESIKSVTPSNNALASPAFSLDRLEIAYGQDDKILISPKRKTEFLENIGWPDKGKVAR